MNTSFKKIKNANVYFQNEIEPFGQACDLVIDFKNKKILALTIKTHSLIPICRTVDIDDIELFERRKIFLKSKIRISNNNILKNEYCQIIDTESLKNICMHQLGKKKFKDLNFNLETGELHDIVVSDGIFTKDTNISSNKIYVNDHTIYIENW